MKLSLCLIIKDEIEQLRRIVDNYEEHFDEIVVAYDSDVIAEMKLPEKVKLFKYELSDEEKKFGGIFFDRKRNFATSCITGDYYFRLDSDDEIVGVDYIRGIAEKAEKHSISIVYCWYNYSRDAWGNVHAGHYRETIVKKDDNLYWNKTIHENIIPKSKIGHNIVIEESVVINHMMTRGHASEAAQRNIKHLIYEYERDGEKTDPRTLAYLGRMMFSIGENEKAQYFLEKHIEKSGWDEDRYMSWCSLAEISLKKERYDDAVGCCFEAISEISDRPDAYLKLHDIYFERQDWAKAIHWGKIGLAQPQPKTFMLQDPSSFTWRPAMSMSHCYLMINDPDTAKKFFDIAAKAAPTLDWIVQNKKVFEDAVDEKRFIEHFIWLFEFLRDKDESRIYELVKAVPDELFDNEQLARIRNLYTNPRIWESNEIAIFCGNTPDYWAAPSVMDGIGGSEEAVIYLSKELTKIGYKVTVFCKCAELAGEYEGVTYKPMVDFNFHKDKFNIVIAWRNNIFKHVEISAKKKIVWLHDMPAPNTYDEHWKFDHIVVLSQYHKSFIKDIVPEEKIFVSTNGVVADDFKKLDIIPKQPHRAIYASSYDRGLDEVLSIWKDVRKEVPDAELHIYYGWNTFDTFVRQGYRNSKQKDRIVELMNQPGVFEHGRVGHRKLLREYAKSSVFVYPTNFAGEINCIAFTKAKATGCSCVTNDKYVLGERNDEYVAKDMVEFKDMLVKALMNPKIIKKGELEKYIEDNSWETVAKQWQDTVLSFKRNEYKDLEHYREHYLATKVFKPLHFIDDEPINPTRYQFVVDSIKDSKSHIDIGCCDGALPILIHKELKIRSDGTEVDKRNVDFATDMAKKKGYDCKFYTTLIEEFEPKIVYDSVSMLEVLEHVIDPKAVLLKLESLVKDGGLIIISTPDKDGYFGEDNYNPQHINHYNKESLSELIGKDRIVGWEETDNNILQVAYKK